MRVLREERGREGGVIEWGRDWEVRKREKGLGSKEERRG